MPRGPINPGSTLHIELIRNFHLRSISNLQQKGELEAEGRRKYELEAEARLYELEENEIGEMPTTEEGNNRAAIRRQELRGEEHCRELG